MRIDEIDFDLPAELIAQAPLAQRDQSRLMSVHRASGQISHQTFRDLLWLLRSGDLLVVNNSRVLPARLLGHKAETGGEVELLLLRPLGDGAWEGLLRPGRRLRKGTSLRFGDHVATCRTRLGEGRWAVVFEPPEAVWEAMESAGRMPLPPYIHQPLDEPERYQTVYSDPVGSAAAPTAGLHFTPELLAELTDRGIGITEVTLHVGLDTFRPVVCEQVEDHRMHREAWEVTPAAAAAVNSTRVAGGRVVAVGTTSVRTLETAGVSGLVEPGDGWTDLFITPGYRFRVVDAMLTNFHMPRTTLCAMVGAFAGQDLIREAYSQAFAERYRLLSFGDAMLIV